MYIVQYIYTCLFHASLQGIINKMNVYCALSHNFVLHFAKVVALQVCYGTTSDTIRRVFSCSKLVATAK